MKQKERTQAISDGAKGLGESMASMKGLADGFDQLCADEDDGQKEQELSGFKNDRLTD